MFGDEDADADADNEGLDHLDDDDFAAYVSTRLVEVEVRGELPEEGLLPSAAAGVRTSPQEFFTSTMPNVQFS